MQRVANGILVTDEGILLLQKPRRGWWVAPGGKMEPGESVKEACMREFEEETGLHLKNPRLISVFTVLIEDDSHQIVDEWMMFSFLATEYSGTVVDHTDEGILSWQSVDSIFKLPMAKGDYEIFRHALSNHSEVLSGTFRYTQDYTLLDVKLDAVSKD
ncbi:8-oxo-dGTP diphosphatase [Bacillus sp. HMF5848]|uniref:NUDIX hydrolase n=1 Tax=Bacillus sp. HMF5848 TaxID=2495421 RepID=UPI000F78B42C|nr:8-oxo-dGTP diphosphatase [Bacillus sp. HMF5848]RSK29437.1 8-oxo-dGTP diphosphatase [Bacillus sp. HMF5848]